MMKNGRVKETILEEAFKLFLSKPYDKVTYTELEKATGFSRGAILHHFRVKITLFEQVIDKYLLQDNSVFDLYEGQAWISVRSFIHISCDWIEDRKRRYKEMGADSYCKALVNLTLQASFFCPAAMEKAFEFSARENGIWSDILKHGIESGELRKDTDVAFIARYIQHLYYGSTFMGALRPEGGDIQFLRKQLLYIYETIKY